MVKPLTLNNMRTRIEIEEHLKNTGYTAKAIIKIMGFLIGKGLKNKDEKMTVQKGQQTFDDFYDWYHADGMGFLIDAIELMEHRLRKIKIIEINI